MQLALIEEATTVLAGSEFAPRWGLVVLILALALVLGLLTVRAGAAPVLRRAQRWLHASAVVAWTVGAWLAGLRLPAGEGPAIAERRAVVRPDVRGRGRHDRAAHRVGKRLPALRTAAQVEKRDRAGRQRISDERRLDEAGVLRGRGEIGRRIFDHRVRRTAGRRTPDEERQREQNSSRRHGFTHAVS